jgi:hypothetical protein
VDLPLLTSRGPPVSSENEGFVTIPIPCTVLKTRKVSSEEKVFINIMSLVSVTSTTTALKDPENVQKSPQPFGTTDPSGWIIRQSGINLDSTGIASVDVCLSEAVLNKAMSVDATNVLFTEVNLWRCN